MPDSSKKAPASYADLSVIQLKTFADRGDPRAQHELDKRMGGPLGHPKAAPAVAPQPLRSVTVPPRLSTEEALARTLATTEPQALKRQHTRPLPLGPDSMTAPLGAPPMPAAAQALATGSLGGAQSDLNEARLFEHLPPGQTLSPELINRLNDIANQAPEPEEQPPLVLGGSMMFVGLLMLLFGFSVTRGPHGTWFFVAVGALLLLSGWLYVKGKAVAVIVYGLSLLGALVWAFAESPSWLEAVLRMLPFIPLSIFAFTPDTRDRLE